MFKIKINNISICTPLPGRVLFNKCSLIIQEGKTCALLGSNGCGKSTFALAITGLLNKNIYSVDASVLYGETDLLNCSLETLNSIRKKNVKYVFQDPVNSFDPLKRFGYYFDTLISDKNGVEEMFEYFLLPSYSEIMERFPHEVSVGMAHRISLILAFMARPELIIMDEPNSSLDLVSSNLLAAKITQFNSAGSSVLLITQDLQFARKCASEIYNVNNGVISPAHGLLFDGIETEVKI